MNDEDNSWALYYGGAILIALLIFGAWFLPPRRSPMNARTGTRTSTGILGRYKFSSPAEVKASNSEMIGWLSQRGYAPCTNETFDAIVGRAMALRSIAAGDEWKMPGLLVSHRYNPTNEVWVFIPECYHADSNIQSVGYHLSLQGGIEVVNKFQADFSSTQKQFQKRFPSTWEYTTNNAEDGAAKSALPECACHDSGAAIDKRAGPGLWHGKKI